MTHFKLNKKKHSQKKMARYMRVYRMKNPEYVLRGQQQRNQIRIKLLEMLGNSKCCNCGYDKDIRALHLDHLNGKGSDEVRLFGSFFKMYNYYYKNPTIAIIKLQVLCANCNMIKQHNKQEWKSPTRIEVNGK